MSVPGPPSESDGEQRLIAGRYRMIAPIGSGGMGTVYSVFDEVIGERVALKLLHATDRPSLDRFVREVALARRVTHRNVARTFDLGFDQGTLFLTMELVVGESVRDRMERGAIGLAEIASIVGQTASGLAAAHEAGVVHCDLKPANVLVGADGRVVLIDFGIAGVAEPDAAGGTELIGTLDYMAPEQLKGAAPKAPSDVYALGIMTFLLLSRRLPFEGERAEARAIARLTGRAASLRGEHGVPGELAALVDRALAVEPGERPPASEFVVAFSALAVAPRIEPRWSSPDGSRVRATTTPPVKSIRVLPFASSGGASGAWDVGASLSEELADVLCRTRGIRVLSSVEPVTAGAIAGHALREADFVINGTVRERGGQLLVTARLVEVATQVALWSGRFDGAVGAAIEWTSQLAARIAEALRVEIEVRASGARVPDEAAELYLQARRSIRAPRTPASVAVKLLDRCLAIAEFPAAVALRAVAIARSYYFVDLGAGDLSREASRAVGRALEVAPSAPDTQLALGIVALLEGRLPTAVQALTRAIEMAPTHALALEQLGRLEIEAGRGARGRERLQLTADLDPMRSICLLPVARAHALRGRIDDFDRVIAKIHSVDDDVAAEETFLQLRVANWTNDVGRARAASARVAANPAHELAVIAAELITGEERTLEFLRASEKLLSLPVSPRFRVGFHQVAAELLATRNFNLAVVQLERVAADPFVDAEWLELCPAIQPLRGLPLFSSLQTKVRERVASMWSA